MNSSSDPAGFINEFDEAKQRRYAMNDLESLIYTIWYVAGVPQDRKYFIGPRQSESYLYKSYQNENAKDKVLVRITWNYGKVQIF